MAEFKVGEEAWVAKRLDYVCKCCKSTGGIISGVHKVKLGVAYKWDRKKFFVSDWFSPVEAFSTKEEAQEVLRISEEREAPELCRNCRKHAEEESQKLEKAFKLACEWIGCRYHDPADCPDRHKGCHPAICNPEYFKGRVKG